MKRIWIWGIALCGIAACGETKIDDDGGAAGTTGGAPRAGAGGRPTYGGGPQGGGGTAPSFAGTAGTPSAAGDAGRGGTGGSSGRGPTLPDGELCGLEFAGGIQCSAEETCRALDCGEAWSLYDGEGCARELCEDSAECPSGQRCVPAPVGGEFTEHCFQEYDSCDRASGECQCYQYEECGPRAVCLDADEFPEERDCPIEGLSCAELEGAAATVRAYVEREGWFAGGGAPGNLGEMVDDCAAKIDGALAACP